mgnify:CR=1 FL=1
MLLDPNATPFDLNFRLFGTPVRVSPWFWLVAAIFGWPLADRGLSLLLLWVFCAFVSILLHEFGHVWAGKAFGTDASILLYSFGGLAIGASDLRSRWQRIVVYLAGPGIQLALWAALCYAVKSMTAAPPEWVILAIALLLQINLYWAILNLLPVWPLDGGKVVRELCTWFSRDGIRISLGISGAVAAFIAIHALIATPDRHIPFLPRSTFIGIFFALMAIESFQLFNQARFFHVDEPDDRLPWER